MELSKIVKNHQAFSERILTELDKVPFGSLQKVELELVILDAIIKSLEPIDSYSNLERHFNYLQSKLKLTQTQLKNKVLAAQLRFDPKTDEDVENFILKSILNGNYSIDGNNVVISILNPLLNDRAKSYFEIRNIISDTSFNKSILKINLQGFVQFLYRLDNLPIEKKLELKQILENSQSEGSIKVVESNSTKSPIEKFEIVTTIGTNLSSIIEKVTPFITNLLS
jgi:hypothetical protein